MRLAAWLLRHRVLVGIGVLAVTALAVAGMMRLEFDDDYRDVFRDDSEEFRFLEQLTEEFGREDNDLFVILPSDGVLRPNGLRRLARLHEEISAVVGGDRVYSLASAPTLAVALRRDAGDERLAQLVADPGLQAVARGRLLSADGRHALVVVGLGDEELDLASLEPLLAEIERVAGLHGAVVTGIPTVRRAVIRAVQRDQVLFNVTALLLGGGLGLLLFRRVIALLMLGIGPALGVVWTLGAMGWAGESINVLNNLVPQLVLVIGFADAVHLLLHFRRARADGAGADEAALATVQRVGLACLLTSVTTAIGFGSLMLARVELVRRFGVACSAGALLSFVAVAVVVPLLCSTRLGDRLVLPDERSRHSRFADRLERWTRVALVRPLSVAVATGAALVVLIGIALQARPDYRYTENLPDDHDAAEVLQMREKAFGGSVPVLVRIGWTGRRDLGSPEVRDAVVQVQEALAAEPLASPVTSFRHIVELAGGDPDAPDGMLRRLPPSLTRRWIRPEGNAVVVAALLPDIGSAALLPRLEALRGRIASAPALRADGGGEGISARVGGLTAVSTAASVRMIGDLGRSLGFAALVIFAAMALAFRSLTLALISLTPNLLPLLSAVAALVLLGIPLQYTGVAVLTIGLGIAVDDTIHFLVAWRRHRTRVGREAAVRRTVRTVGQALVTTTGLLVVGLATLAISDLPTIRQFGLLMCLLLVVALVADLLALPALTILFDPAPGRVVSRAPATPATSPGGEPR